jgi:hypothetical protein
MRGNAIGARRNRKFRGAHRIGMMPPPRIADGGDMIDVNAKTDMGRAHFVSR